MDFADKIPLFYQHASELFDYMAKSFIKAGTKNLPSGNFFKLFQNMSQIFPMAMLSGPFLASLWHQRLDNHIKTRLQEKLGIKQGKKALWLSDKLDNKILAKQISEQGYNISFISCDQAPVSDVELKNIKNFKPFTNFELSDISGADVQQLGINFPSLFLVMDEIMQQKADSIIISEPTPLGWIAWLCGQLLNIPVKGLYSDQYSQQAMSMVDDADFINLVKNYETFFYKQLEHTYFLTESDSEKTRNLNTDSVSVLSCDLQNDSNCNQFLQLVFGSEYCKHKTSRQITQPELEAIA